MRFVILIIFIMLGGVLCLGYGKDAVRFQVTEIDIAGVPDSLGVPDEITLAIPLLYDSVSVKRAALAMARHFAENGYPYSSITTIVTPNDDLPIPDDLENFTGSVRDVPREDGFASDSVVTLTIRFTVVLDELVCNGPSAVAGVPKNVWMYLRDVRLAPGRPYSVADVDETVRRLSIRPYVREVVAGAPVIIEDETQHGGAEPCADDTAATPCADTLSLACGGLGRVAVTPFIVTVNRGMEIEGALGFESGRDGEDGKLSGRLDLSFLNMLGRGENISSSYAGTREAQKLAVAASCPWVFALPLEVGVKAALEIEDEGYGYFEGTFSCAAEVNAKWKYGAAARASETVPPDTVGDAYRFYGVDFFMSLMQTRPERGKTVLELSLLTGSGVADREISYARSRMELAAGIHKPVRLNYAAAARLCAVSLFTDEDYLPPAELYRIGGHGSLRGYSEEEFAFRTAVYSQVEGLYYFSRAGAVFIFLDGGFGWGASNRLKLSAAEDMLGYGMGLRFPSRLGTVSVEWARNINDGSSLGRVHVGVRKTINN